MKSKYWSTAEFAENRRANKNYIMTPSLFAIDIDGGLTIEQAEATLLAQGYAFAIATTRNHRIAKDGVVADRFRVLLVLERSITSAESHLATWKHVVAEILPQADPACKDPARGYYYSTSLYCIHEGNPLPVKDAPPAISLKQLVNSQMLGKRQLERDTKTLLERGVGKGKRDIEIFKAALDFKSSGFELDEALAQILAAPIEFTADFTPGDAEHKVREVYSRQGIQKIKRAGYGSGGFKAFIQDSLLLEDIEGNESPLLFNTTTFARQKTTLGIVRKALGGDEAYGVFCQERFQAVLHRYHPFSASSFLTDEHTGIQVYNVYEPPLWYSDVFYNNAPLPKAESEPPALVKEFLMHLVGDDKNSYEYLLDWLAQAIQGRNLTVLATVGAPGIGKGTLASMMQFIFGPTNYCKVRGVEIFKSKFNPQLANKRMVYIDEAHIVGVEEYSRFKDVVNSEIEVERKGIDPVSIKNFSSFYLSCNEASSIQLPKGDRRFSIINLTNRPIKDTDAGFRERIGRDACHLVEPSLLTEFAFYLTQRKVKHDMYQPFRAAEKTAEVVEGGLRDWERYLVFEYLYERVGQTIPLQAVQDDIRLNCKMFSPPGRNRIKALCEKYPEYMRFARRDNKFYLRVLAAPSENLDGVEMLEPAKEPNNLEWAN